MPCHCAHWQCLLTSILTLLALSTMFINVFAGNSFDIPIGGIQGISIASVIFFIPLVALVYQLAGFHILLNMHGITTYEFIVRESNKAHERKNAPQIGLSPGSNQRSQQRPPESPKEYSDLARASPDGDVEISSL